MGLAFSKIYKKNIFISSNIFHLNTLKIMYFQAFYEPTFSEDKIPNYVSDDSIYKTIFKYDLSFAGFIKKTPRV